MKRILRYIGKHKVLTDFGYMEPNVEIIVEGPIAGHLLANALIEEVKDTKRPKKKGKEGDD